MNQEEASEALWGDGAIFDQIQSLVDHRVIHELRNVAHTIECELICCDVFEEFRGVLKKTSELKGHSICFWGGASRSLVLERADEIEKRYLK